MQVDEVPSFVGRGIAFPMRVDHTGRIATTTGVDDIDRGIRVVLSTAPGERVMRPAFGCRIWELMFEPINATTLGLMGEAVRESLVRWEPRIDVLEVDVRPDFDDPGVVRIGIEYRVRVTNDHRNLVYPFYVIPGEGGPTEKEPE